MAIVNNTNSPPKLKKPVVDGLFKFIDQLYLLLSRMNYIVYILKSSIDGGYYDGYTSDLEERLMRHNEGLVRSTKAQPSFW